MPAISLYDLRQRARGFNARSRANLRGRRVFLRGPGTAASLTTALTGSNNDLVYTALNKGESANAITVQYVVAGNNTPLTVVVTGWQDIKVNVATDGSGVATSTAAQVKAAVQANFTAQNMVTVANAGGNDGTGVVTAMAKTNLAGGAW